MLESVNLQAKTSAEIGTISLWYFDRDFNGLKTRALFHKIEVPLAKFKPGLVVYPESIKTQISMDWIELKLEDPTDLDGINISSFSCLLYTSPSPRDRG